MTPMSHSPESGRKLLTELTGKVPPSTRLGLGRPAFVGLLLFGAALTILLEPEAAGAGLENPTAKPSPIDRHTVVTRNDVLLSGPAPLSPLQVGNGQFAFNVDITGLQTLYGNTLSTWGWHEAPPPAGMKPEDRKRTEFVTHGRTRYYLAPPPPEQKELVQWLYDNPHRANLGRLRLATRSGVPVKVEDLTNMRQRLDLWTGLITSEFELGGKPVRVETCSHPGQDLVAVRIQSPLLAEGGLRVRLDFSYPEHSFRWGPKLDRQPHLGNWAAAQKHQTQLLRREEGRVDVERKADAMTYKVALAWTGGFSLEGLAADQTNLDLESHAVCLSNSHTNTAEIVCAFTPDSLPHVLPSFEETRVESAKQWCAYWQAGGAIDLSGSKDARWRELERRIILSQYLMRVNSSGSAPPQECGLLSDSWCGKFHLEMTAWHGAHFMFWGRPDCMQGWLTWMQDVGLPAARREAQAEGWPGAKWLKTPDPRGRWESWDHGPNRVTQNIHPLYWAELAYRAKPDRQTLERWQEMVFETARFLAAFPAWDEKTQRYILGPPIMSGAEAESGFADWNPTSELNYWALALEIAQKWRERLGLPREQNWEHVLQHLSRPPVVNGVYIDAESHPGRWNRVPPDGHWLRPAWFEVYGCVRGPLIEPPVMEKTYQRAAEELRQDLWKGNLWGTDYPMMAMTAARLGKPGEAVQWLLHQATLNQYTPNGFCAGWYLPGNGGLLWAIAMMAAGWDGAPSGHAPGFPNDGSWSVRWEGLKPIP
jgi:hypothetical protein